MTLCHRRSEFSGARAALVQRVLMLEKEGMLQILREARVTSITPDRVHFDVAGQPAERENDFVFVLVGGVPPYELLKQCGGSAPRFCAPPSRSSPSGGTRDTPRPCTSSRSCRCGSSWSAPADGSFPTCR